MALPSALKNYWAPSKRLLSDASFLQQLKDYDKDNISPKIIKAIRSRFVSRDDFVPKKDDKGVDGSNGSLQMGHCNGGVRQVAKIVAPKGRS